MGTIFGIYKVATKNPTVDLLLTKGTEMIAAGYCMYGSSTCMVLTTGGDVHGYTLDTSCGEFILTHPSVSWYFEKILKTNVSLDQSSSERKDLLN